MSWLRRMIPKKIDSTVSKYFVSNAKHIIVGLEMKAGLIIPHHKSRKLGSVLFEPYFQVMTFEFCVGVFSICEGLGSFIHLANNDKNATDGDRVNTNEWITALATKYDYDGSNDMEKNLRIIKLVRDKMHQDKLGLRHEIDWHSFDYDRAFLPALKVIQTMLAVNSEVIPIKTNLLPEH
jgi:hypothetical protein